MDLNVKDTKEEYQKFLKKIGHKDSPWTKDIYQKKWEAVGQIAEYKKIYFEDHKTKNKLHNFCLKHNLP